MKRVQKYPFLGCRTEKVRKRINAPLIFLAGDLTLFGISKVFLEGYPKLGQHWAQSRHFIPKLEESLQTSPIWSIFLHKKSRNLAKMKALGPI